MFDPCAVGRLHRAGEVDRAARGRVVCAIPQDKPACEHNLTAPLVRHAVHERLCNRGVGPQGALEDLGGNHCAVCQHNHVIEAAVHIEEPVLVDVTHIARVQPAVSVFSFGFKYGVPLDADIVIDVRFLPNPYYDPTMAELTGHDELVRDFVLGREETRAFTAAWFNLLDVTMPGYVAEGKKHLAIAVGCTGGQHRSVVIAEATAAHLIERGYNVSVGHRDLPRHVKA